MVIVRVINQNCQNTDLDFILVICIDYGYQS